MNRFLTLCAISLVGTGSAESHEWYSGLHGKDGQLCCGGEDCAPTVWKERGGEFFFMTRDKHWLFIPQERITFLPVPGDESEEVDHKAHLCYRDANDMDSVYRPENVFVDESGKPIYFYCGFINPGAI